MNANSHFGTLRRSLIMQSLLKQQIELALNSLLSLLIGVSRKADASLLAAMDMLASGTSTPGGCKMKKKSNEGNCETNFVPEDGEVCKFDSLSTAMLINVDFKLVTKGVLTEGSKFSVTQLTAENCNQKNKIDYQMTAIKAAETNRYILYCSQGQTWVCDLITKISSTKILSTRIGHKLHVMGSQT